MKYRTKPREIEAIEFDGFLGGDLPDFVNLRRGPDEQGPDGWQQVFEVWNEEHSSWIRVAPGDMLRVDDPGDVYPIARAKFEETYEPVEEGGTA